jgi:hypothetical protein
MINGPMIGGFMVALTLIFGTLFVGTWFSSVVAFSDAHSLDAARVSKPFVCSFNLEEAGSKITGNVRSRDGIMYFQIRDDKDGVVSEWGVEVNMNNTTHMMTQAGPNEPFVKLDDYPDLRVQVLENLKMIIRGERLHCAPWWSGKSYRFQMEGRL